MWSQTVANGKPWDCLPTCPTQSWQLELKAYQWPTTEFLTVGRRVLYGHGRYPGIKAGLPATPPMSIHWAPYGQLPMARHMIHLSHWSERRLKRTCLCSIYNQCNSFINFRRFVFLWEQMEMWNMNVSTDVMPLSGVHTMMPSVVFC